VNQKKTVKLQRITLCWSSQASEMCNKKSILVWRYLCDAFYSALDLLLTGGKTYQNAGLTLFPFAIIFLDTSFTNPCSDLILIFVFCRCTKKKSDADLV